jgi:hypothetical protein
MGLAAAYDLAFGIAPVAAFLGITLPANPVYLGLVGVLLLVLGTLYLLPARSPVRYQGIVAVAACGRVFGFVYLAHSWRSGQPQAFLWLALIDLGFGALHAVLLFLAKRTASG